MSTRAGKVKITPAARDSPADAEVCTILFSRMLWFLKKRSINMESTAAGIEADTVIPANNPRYAFAAERTIDNKAPNMNALIVVSGNLSSLPM